jgi:hypothetical protein
MFIERIVPTFRLETLNPTSDAVIPIRLKKVTIDEISSASAYIKNSNFKLDKEMNVQLRLDLNFWMCNTKYLIEALTRQEGFKLNM